MEAFLSISMIILFVGGILLFGYSIYALIKKKGRNTRNFVSLGVVLALFLIFAYTLGTIDDSTEEVSAKPVANESKKNTPEKLKLDVDNGKGEHSVAYDMEEYNLTGDVNKDAELEVNGERVPVSNEGEFDTTITLKEGKNDISIVSTLGDQRQEWNLSVDRQSKADHDKQVAEDKKKQEQAEAKAKAEEVARKKKEAEEKRQAKLAAEKKKREEAEKERKAREKEAASERASSQSDPNISKDEFSRIRNGMSYKEVTSIIGGEGELLSESGEGQYHTVMYQYWGENGGGANANIMFQGGKLISKAQFGLE